MRTTGFTPAARRLFAISIVARAPLTMFSMGLLVHTQHLTGSFAAAGVVTGAYALAVGVGGPLLGGLVDRRGQTVVLLSSAGVACALLVTTALVPAGTPVPVLIALGVGVGLATPPLGACVRTLFPTLLREPDKVRAAYALDASASELTWISGPPFVLGIGVLWSTGAALAIGGSILLLGTAAFAAQPASRAWRPAGVTSRQRGGSLRAPALRTLMLVMTAVGLLFGAVEVAVAATGESMDRAAAVGPLLGLWGLGSLVGGLLAARLGGAESARRLALLLGAMTAGHLALSAATGSIVTLGVVLLVAGAAIAPTYAAVYALVDRTAPRGALTEAFAWIATAISLGAAAGAAIAGVVADHAGPEAAFALAGGAGGIALLTAALRSRTIVRPETASEPRHMPSHDELPCPAAA
jgi:MFS family permease